MRHESALRGARRIPPFVYSGATAFAAATGQGLGTGLTALRERLKLASGNEAQPQLAEVEPLGVCAELTFPARSRAT